MRRLLFLVGIGFLLAIGIILWTFLNGDAPLAMFLVRSLLALGTLSAVLTALFGDALRETVDPIRVTIEVPERNNIFDKCELGGRIYTCYCHHLRVLNMTPHRAIKHCRVWLERIRDIGPDGRWDDKTRFAVPRLMEWAPLEYSPDKRTFSTHQVFDFGKTLSDNEGFEFTIFRDQGGTFPRRLGVGEKRRFIFYVSGDNYQRKEQFCFEVRVPKSEDPMKVAPAEITPVKDWQ